MSPDERLSRIWARSGAAGLSGRADGPPLPVPLQLIRVTEEAAGAFCTAAERMGSSVTIDGPALLGERAALAGVRRRGDISCGAAARLLRAADGHIALSLARDDDIESVPAWLERPMPRVLDALWHEIGAVTRERTAVDLVERGVLLGMPIARLGEVLPAASGGPVRTVPLGTSSRGRGRGRATSMADVVVLDLSALWAGPLCANLLGLVGARIVKVESASRPDGARHGPAAFFDLLHAGHDSVALDFRDAADRRVLHRLVDAADVVITSSRPRALDQLGVGPQSSEGPSVWVAITGHGRDGDAGLRVGFGDDAAIAGGLATRDERGPCFCADAVADPLTGLLAAAATMGALADGSRVVVDAALSRSAAWASTGPLTVATDEPIAAPHHRSITGVASPLGADTDTVISDLAR